MNHPTAIFSFIVKFWFVHYDYSYRVWREFTDVHHIAVYYSVRKISGELVIPEQFSGQDSLGALWVSPEDVTIDNASPLVLKAFEWMKKNQLGIEAKVYKTWEVAE